MFLFFYNIQTSLSAILAAICSVIGILLILVGCGFCYFYNKTKYEEDNGSLVGKAITLQMSELQESPSHNINTDDIDNIKSTPSSNCGRATTAILQPKYGELLQTDANQQFGPSDNEELLSDYDGIDNTVNVNLISDDLADDDLNDDDDDDEDGDDVEQIAVPQHINNTNDNQINGEGPNQTQTQNDQHALNILVGDDDDGNDDTQ